jgi:hypothetical protein
MAKAYGISATESIERITREINALPSQAATAAMRALNKTAAWVKSVCSKKIAKEKLIKLKIVRDRIRVVQASRTSLQRRF